MISAIEQDTFVVAIDHDEACQLMAGEVIGDRRNPLDDVAKVSVAPMSDWDLSYPSEAVHFGEAGWEERIKSAHCVGQFMSDLDVVVYVPFEVVSYALIGFEHIARDALHTMAQGREREALLTAFPSNGLLMCFDGGQRLAAMRRGDS